MSLKRWKFKNPDKALAKQLAEDCALDPFAAMLAEARGITDATDLELLLSPEPMLCNPWEFVDMQRAVLTVRAALDAHKRIAVFGDYDCDGVCATALLYTYLKSVGADVFPYIPDRLQEGYGMNAAAVDAAAAKGAKLIITVDNGISCHEAIAHAAECDIQTVVTDHHLPGDTLPPAAAVIDPHRADCPSPFKEICGTAVVFQLVCALADVEPEQLLPQFADLLCIATVGDVMPLLAENRSMVRAGLACLRAAPRVGISALISVAGLDRSQLNIGNVSFGIVPRLNAAGRMGSANRAFSLLICENGMEALALANELQAENALRQKLEREITQAAIEKLEQSGGMYRRVIVVVGEHWHPGVVGIVAARLADRYGKPAIVLTAEGDTASGSGRSLPGFSLFTALQACSDHLTRYGGHAQAAGLGLELQQLDAFCAAMEDYAKTLPVPVPEIEIDLKLNPQSLSVDMVEAIETLAPFGAGFPPPLFALCAVQLLRVTPIGNGKHLKLIFSKNETPFQALLFGVTPQQFCFAVGDVCDLAVSLSVNEYQGTRGLTVQIRAMRLNGSDTEKILAEAVAVDDFFCGDVLPAELAPDRAQIGRVYRLLQAGSVPDRRFDYVYAENSGYAQTRLALKVLSELNLISLQNGCYTAVAMPQKTDLLCSPTFAAMTKGERQ